MEEVATEDGKVDSSLSLGTTTDGSPTSLKFTIFTHLILPSRIRLEAELKNYQKFIFEENDKRI